MSINRMLRSKDELAKLDEDSLRSEVVIPLLVKMGYEDAYEYHGTGELGKDVVGSRRGELDELVNLAVVVKKGKVAGKAAKEVARQVRQSFNTTFRAQFGNEERKPTKVWVITNGPVPGASREQILTDIEPTLKNHTIIIDIDKLWKLWSRYFGLELQNALDVVQQEVRELEHGMNVKVTVVGSTKSVEIFADGSLGPDDNPFPVSGRLKFPNTPEGRARMEELEVALDTGAEVELPGEFIEIQVPEVLRRISEQALGVTPGNFSSVQISSVEDPREFPTRIEFLCDDGDRAVLDYVVFRVSQQGRKETTLTNCHQAAPIGVSLIFSNHGSGRILLQIYDEAVPVKTLLTWLDVQRCMAKSGRTTFTLLETGARWGSTERQAQSDQPPAEEPPAVLRELAVVQDLLGQPIYVPNSEPSAEEKQVIALLRKLLREPVVEGTWTAYEVGIAKQQASAQLAPFADGEAAAFAVTEVETVELGEHPIALGTVVYEFVSAVLDDSEEQAQHLQDDGKDYVLARFLPGDSDKVRKHYVDWPTSDARTQVVP